MAKRKIKVLGICGSLRKSSLNMQALRATSTRMPDDMVLTSITEIGDLPLYNQDTWDAGLPDSVKRFRAEVAASDAVLIAAAEYNFSMSAALKNAIDWGSRGHDQVFQDKPIAIFSATTGHLGGPRVQYELRKIFTSIWGLVLPRPEIFIGNAQSKFDAMGHLIDETTGKLLVEMMAGFREWILRLHPDQFQD